MEQSVTPDERAKLVAVFDAAQNAAIAAVDSLIDSNLPSRCLILTAAMLIEAYLADNTNTVPDALATLNTMVKYLAEHRRHTHG